MSVAGVDRHLDFPENRRMMRIEEFLKFLVLAVNRLCVLCQIIGADREEIDLLCKLISDHNGRRRLDHDAERDILERNILIVKLLLDLLAVLLRLLNFPDGCDHREHNIDISERRCAVQSAELCLKDFRSRQADADRAEAERRVILVIEIEVTDLLVRADVERADDNLLAGHHLSDCSVRLELLLLCRIVIALQVQKLRAEKTNSGSVILKDEVEIADPADIRVQLDLAAGLRDCLLALQLTKQSLLLFLCGRLLLILLQSLLIRIYNDAALKAIDNSHLSVNIGRDRCLAESRDIHRSCEDSRVRIRGAASCDKCKDLALVELDCL